MAVFSELIRNFDKTRDYMRDFYVYGFKQRVDFGGKSARTYDNEKRRIESWLGQFVRWQTDKSGKRVFLSVESEALATNPLYAAWQAKSFTNRDILLHFHILDALRTGEKTVEEITDWVCAHSGQTLELQTVRLKCAEYAAEGVLCAKKQGKAHRYSLSEAGLDVYLLDAVKFYQMAAPFGEVGAALLANVGESNEIFRFKHHYIMHTLEDGVLHQLLCALRNRQEVAVENHSARTGRTTVLMGVPLKILQSTVTGRRYVCMYDSRSRRFCTQRLDSIKRVKAKGMVQNYEQLSAALQRNMPLLWGVSFGQNSRKQIVCLKLVIDEVTEPHVLARLLREGRGGEVVQLERGLYLYTRECFDAGEMAAWVKTFIGYVVQFECSDAQVVDKFYRDVRQMQEMYESDEEAD